MVLSMMNVWTSRIPSNLKATEPLNAEPVSVEVDKAEIGAQDGVDTTGVYQLIGAEDAPSSEKAAVTEIVPATLNSESAVEPFGHLERPSHAPQRLSFRSLGLFYGQRGSITHEKQENERQKARDAAKYVNLSLHSLPSISRSADRRAQNNALAVQRLIVGPSNISPTNAKKPPVSRAQLATIKSELMQPKSANRLIAKLRALPMPDGPVVGEKADAKSAVTKTNGPIHAVCLERTESDASTRNFSKLGAASVATASIDALVTLFNELHVVDLLSAPELGLGQPGDGEGLLAGAVPTAETIIEGVQKLTPQLMALGYATGKAIVPDHTGVHPPVDRMSVITYWWGFELCMPPPTLAHLNSVESISHEVVNFLTALSLMNDGVREILPFVRYISQFVDFEFKEINAQNKGKGAVCAATWIMPAAMVPRPWDFPDSSAPADEKKENPDVAEAPRTGEGVVEDINPMNPGLFPSLVVTPPSVIKPSPALPQAAPENSERTERFTPAWHAVNMGTGAISILFHTFPYGTSNRGMQIVAFFFLLLNLALFIVLTIFGVTRYTTFRGLWSSMIRHPVASLYLGCFPMGFATIIISAVGIVHTYFGLGGVTFLYVLWALWWVDVALSLLICFGQLHVMFTRQTHEISTMTMIWLLPVVTLTVASSAGAAVAQALIPFDTSRVCLTLAVCTALVTIGIMLALSLYTIYLHRLVVHGLPEGTTIFSVFLPLGPLGQAGFAYLLIGEICRDLFPLRGSSVADIFVNEMTPHILYVVAWVISFALWSFATCWLLLAFLALGDTMMKISLPFTLSFWGMIFPNLATTIDSEILRVWGSIYACFTLLLWTFAVFRTLPSAWDGSIFESPCLSRSEGADITDEVIVHSDEEAVQTVEETTNFSARPTEWGSKSR
ncbi:hypothetical protein EW145_g4029 [Phellinidium pouzarii]|uniref:Uncharacterized protein n=1 Tax=Phellinidium pouzarii TaxID=167371 RepID=A0A4S4L4Z7_9AGAM|nr:hypothetical protein EW145_g4029 [Phellinidium pouzarii]